VKLKKIARLPVGEFFCLSPPSWSWLSRAVASSVPWGVPRGLPRDRGERSLAFFPSGTSRRKSALRRLGSDFSTLLSSSPSSDLRRLHTLFLTFNHSPLLVPPIHSCTNLTTKPRQIDGKRP
jgi:hypothetical protein